MTQIHQAQTKHIHALDSLRGYAALTVLLHHYSAINASTIAKHKFLGLYNYFTTGPQAVILFFVLSGYVLSLSLNNHITYLQFIVRRIFRVYPVYLLVIFLLMVLYYVSSHAALLRYLGVDYFTAVVDKKFIINAITLVMPVLNPYSNNHGVPNRTGFPFDIVTWSLTYEMIISFLFPFMYYIYNKMNGVALYILFTAHLISACFLIYCTHNLIAYVYYYTCFFGVGNNDI